jgi:flavin-dependent dehydrogenase
MAAATAAGDGLKTILFEEKREVTRIDRACSQIFYVRKLSPSGSPGDGSGKPRSDGYIDPVEVESRSECTRFHFPIPGFYLDYTGPLRPYLNWFHVSPKGYRVNRYGLNIRPWGFYFQKDAFVAGLLRHAVKSGAEVVASAKGLSAENVGNVVRFVVEVGSEIQTHEARAVVVADGLLSRVAETAGFNFARRAWSGRRMSFLQYIMEGVETGVPDASCSWLTWTVPSINPTGYIAIGLSEISRVKVGTLVSGNISPDAVLKKFITDPRFASMFRQARIVKKEGTSRTRGFINPVRDPVSGNIVITGDAGSINETWIQGAVASGYKAVKAIKQELDGKKGYEDYRNWWLSAFAFNTPDYLKMVSQLYPLPRICSDEEIDYLWHLFDSRTGIPQLMVHGNMAQIEKDRPELYAKLAAFNTQSR